MQGFRESENGAILEYITNQRFAENHCALSAEDLGVRERVRRVRLNWTVHVPVSRSLQGNGAEKRNSERFVKGSLEEDSHKRDGGRCLREVLDEGTYKRDGGRCLREGLEEDSYKRDGERCLREGLDEDSHKRDGGRKVTKRDGGRIMRGCTDEDVPKGTVGGCGGVR